MLPNKLTDFFDKPAWINRTLFYATIFVIIALIFIIIFGIFNLIFPNFTFPNNTIDYDNERYLLSALVQSLAATIALVITLSLVAVQLAAQSYSARVIDVYKRNPDMWILLCIYIFTIFYGLGLTKIIGLGILGNYMEGAIFVAYFMGFFAFVCLVPYMLKTLDLLKPSTVIKLLAEEITKENIMKIYRNENTIDENDPVQPIMDIIYNALQKNDSETIKNGLFAIKNTAIELLKNTDFNELEEWTTILPIAQHIENVGIKSSVSKNEYAMKYAILSLEEIGIESIKKECYDSAGAITKSLVGLEKHATEQGYRQFQLKIIFSLEEMGKEAAKKEQEIAIGNILSILQYIGDDSIANDFKVMTNTVIRALQKIGIETANIPNRELSKMVIDSLEKLSRKENMNLQKRIWMSVENIRNTLEERTKKT